MGLRVPQEASLRKLHELVSMLRTDLADTSPDDLIARLQELQPTWDLTGGFPRMTITLATGVGKTRLMGALIAYLYLAGQSRTFLMLAPRRAILNKLLVEAEPDSPKYLFVDPGLLPDVRVWHAGNAEAFEPSADDDRSTDLFIFSPQSFTGADPRIARGSEFAGTSVVDYLAGRRDLVVLADESHHLGVLAEEETRAWTRAIRDVKPRLQFGMTATPLAEPGMNLLYSYDLRTCLRDKRYTKDVRLIVRQRTEADGISDEDWDHLTLDFALDRLARVEAAIANYTGPTAFPQMRPVALVAASDTKHADRIAEWLIEHRGFDGEQVLVTHSRRSKSERDIERLVGIQEPDSSVRVVVNVFELTEGWDVTNVYVVAPLRAMGTYQGAIQAMGRGLRLPAGHRIDDVELDSLDVLCFGRESLKDILDAALEDYGLPGEEGPSVGILDADDQELHRPSATMQVEVAAAHEQSVEMPHVRRVPDEPNLDFDIKSVTEIAKRAATELDLVTGQVAGTAEGLKYDFDVAARLAASRVIATLPYLSDPLHGAEVEGLAKRLLTALGHEVGGEVEIDWLQLAAVIAEQIDRRYRRKAPAFEVTGEAGSITFGAYPWNVPEDFENPVALASIKEWGTELRRVPITGWSRCTAEAPAFDTSHEFLAAKILDKARALVWWARNDPPRLVVPTPIGGYGPDFVMEVKSAGGSEYVILEVKRADMWESPLSDARVKARAAGGWCAAVTTLGGGVPWSYIIVLDVDVRRAETFDDLAALSVASSARPVGTE
jgi:superfamily II DNA or RNA helicase